MTIRSNDNSSPRFESLLGRLRRFLSRGQEFALMTAQEVDEIARELNLSSSDLRNLAGESGRREMLLRRLEHAGLSEEALASLHPDVLRDLQRVCSLCGEKAHCAADLARERRASPAKYCPNELTLTALSRESGPSASPIDVDQSRDAGTVIFLASSHQQKATT